MKLISQRLTREPVLCQALVQSILVFLAVFGVLDLNNEELAVSYGLTAAILAFITRAHVMPIAARASSAAVEVPADDAAPPASASPSRTSQPSGRAATRKRFGYRRHTRHVRRQASRA